MNRRRFLYRLLGGAAGLAAGRAAGPPRLWANETRGARRPNVIVILTDDQGYGDASFNAHDTPLAMGQLDRLARHGVTFTDGYAGACMCTPSRACLLSGRYHGRVGMYDVGGDAGVGFPRDVKLLPEYLKDLGYATGCIGKWHVGGEIEGFEYNHPLQRGFDRFWGFLGSTHDYWNPDVGSGFNSTGYTSCGYNPIYDQHEPVPHINYLTDEINRQAERFVRAHAGEPFFLYIAHHCPHVPLHARQEVFNKYDGMAMGYHTQVTRAMYEAVDEGLGRLQDLLTELGLTEDTLIIYSSDNGGSEPCGQLNGPLRGGKFSLLEGGIRVPLVMTWPGRIPADRVYAHPVINLDFMPTILAAAGVKPPANCDGVDLLPYLTGRRGDAPHEMLFWMMPPHTQEYAVRAGDWKLVYTATGRGLFNLRQDRGERRDLSAAHPDTVARLQHAYEQWRTHNIPPVFTPEMQRRYWSRQSDDEKDTRNYEYGPIPQRH